MKVRADEIARLIHAVEIVMMHCNVDKGYLDDGKSYGDPDLVWTPRGRLEKSKDSLLASLPAHERAKIEAMVDRIRRGLKP